jgi:hypothetical protein
MTARQRARIGNSPQVYHAAFGNMSMTTKLRAITMPASRTAHFLPQI